MKSLITKVERLCKEQGLVDRTTINERLEIIEFRPQRGTTLTPIGTEEDSYVPLAISVSDKLGLLMQYLARNNGTNHYGVGAIRVNRFSGVHTDHRFKRYLERKKVEQVAYIFTADDAGLAESQSSYNKIRDETIKSGRGFESILFESILYNKRK